MRSVTDADVLRIMSQPREDFGHRGPTEDPADTKADRKETKRGKS